jgi:superfamily II DNA helicase RecQ
VPPTSPVNEETALSYLPLAVNNPQASSRSELQRDAILQSLAPIVPLLIILPTGHGKPLIPIITSAIDRNKTTLVIVPFLAATMIDVL